MDVYNVKSASAHIRCWRGESYSRRRRLFARTAEEQRSLIPLCNSNGWTARAEGHLAAAETYEAAIVALDAAQAAAIVPLTFDLVPADGDFSDYVLGRDGARIIGTKPSKRFHMRALHGENVVYTSLPMRKQDARAFGEKYCADKNAVPS